VIGMRVPVGAIAIGVFVQAAAAAALAQAADDQPAERMLRHAGVDRSYLAYVPSAARGRGAPPVLIVLHGRSPRSHARP
jgi:poly(3-hydroxybutyrate) depolymerase